ncbi:MAG: phytanoyl-CoA dioxygenase family protein [Actinomycetota bacterium]|nr:phytanoyl-CoA dioxygenase family protein [Actinomycetota bacterium]
MPVPRFTADVDASAVVTALAEQGCAIVERLAPPELCDRVEHELAPYAARTPTGSDDFAGRNTRRTGALLARSPSATELVAHPLVLDVVDGVLGGGTTRYQLHLTQAIAIGPGSPAQPLHRDQWCFDFHPFPADLDVEVSTIWALTKFTAENGATRVVPASHRSEGQPYGEEDTELAVMPRGSVVLYLGSPSTGAEPTPPRTSEPA